MKASFREHRYVLLWAVAYRTGQAHGDGKKVAVACGLSSSRTNLVSSAQVFVSLCGDVRVWLYLEFHSRGH